MDLKEARHKQNTQRHPWEMSRWNFFVDLMRKPLKKMDEEGAILMDLGCGDTWFVEQLAAKYRGIRFLAVDINFSEEDLVLLGEKYQDGQIQVFKSLEEACTAMGEESASMILLLDVIEHIEDDIGFLQHLKASTAVAKSTDLVITVPAFQQLFSSHDVFLDHYRRYTNSSLQAHCRQAGWQCREKGYFFFSLLLARFIMHLKERAFGEGKATTGLVEWNKGAFVTGLITTFLITDYKIGRLFKKLGITLPGLSNYGICNP